MTHHTPTKNTISTSHSPGLGQCIAYGIFWWILGGLILMPSKLNMPLFHLNTMAWQSFMGHIIFGAVLGALAVVIPRRMHK